MKIAIFGGSFNPIHNGHISIAKRLKRILNLDKVIFLPTKFPPHKKIKYATPYQRYKMVKLAIQNIKDFSVSKMEIKSTVSTNYTIDSIRRFKRRYKKSQLYFIIGSDEASIINRWKSVLELFSLCKFVVIPRRGFSIRNVPLNIRKKFLIIKLPFMDVSSSKIRKKIQDEVSIKKDIPKEVLKYITKNNLYRYK